MIRDTLILFFVLSLYNYAKLLIVTKICKKHLLMDFKNNILFFIYNLIFFVICSFFGTGLHLVFTFVLSIIFYKFILSIHFNLSIFSSVIFYLFLELIIIPCEYLFTFLNSSSSELSIFIKSFIVFIYLILHLTLYDRKGFYKLTNTIHLLFYNNPLLYITGVFIINCLSVMYFISLSLDGNVKLIIMLIILIFQLIFIISICILLLVKKKFISFNNKRYNKLLNDYKSLEEEYSMLRHNLTNELLAIKCADDRSINKLLDEVIFKYKRDYEIADNFKTLKKGIEGIIEIKLNEASHNGINIYINNSTDIDIYSYLEDKYLIISDVVGIVLDNAIESAKDSIDKVIYVDINYIDDELNIKVVNSFANGIDIDSIYKANYSTKDRNSGLGLNYINSIDTNIIRSNIEIINSLFIFNINV